MAPKRKAAAKPAASTSNDATDYAKLTVAQLRAECSTKGLDDTGKKQELIDRLNESEDGDQPSPPKLSKKSTIERAMDVMKTTVANEQKNKKKRMVAHKVDQHFRGDGVVFKDYDCMLNQTNIGNNNNKYYVIQVIEDGCNYYAFNRWGRVGEPGATAQKGPFSDSDDAIKDFEKKFQDKTKNKWDNRGKFKAVPGKYTLLEMGDQDEDAEQDQATITVTKDGKPMGKMVTRPSQLDAATQAFVKLIFDNDMFKDALIKMDIDVKKMPLGKLSKSQILKGFEILDDIKKALDVKTSAAKLTQLSNDFYTAVPHDFGRKRPEIINDQDLLRKKLDMLITLSDIEMAQDMLKKKPTGAGGKKAKASDLPPHPLDENYEILKCKLEPLKKSENEFKVIEKYVDATGKNCYSNMKLLDVWRMERESEDDRFKAHEKIANRKLLWHGTNVAVVAAILKSGLRIMPHSGGRVGRGIYLASENSKSAGYVGTTSDNVGIMFLAEAALGKEHTLLRDDSSLKSAPSGFDSIVARGHVEPDPKLDTSLNLSGKKVVVPQGKPINTTYHGKSSFGQSEYLVYKESQVRLRYVLKLKMY